MDERADVLAEFEAWYAHCRDNDALDPKTKALIGLAVVITGNCEP